MYSCVSYLSLLIYRVLCFKRSHEPLPPLDPTPLQGNSCFLRTPRAGRNHKSYSLAKVSISIRSVAAKRKRHPAFFPQLLPLCPPSCPTTCCVVCLCKRHVDTCVNPPQPPHPHFVDIEYICTARVLIKNICAQLTCLRKLLPKSLTRAVCMCITVCV